MAVFVGEPGEADVGVVEAVEEEEGVGEDELGVEVLEGEVEAASGLKLRVMSVLPDESCEVYDDFVHFYHGGCYDVVRGLKVGHGEETLDERVGLGVVDLLDSVAYAVVPVVGSG